MKVAIVMPLAEQRGGAELMLLHLLRGSRGFAGVTYSVVFLEHGPMVDEVRALGYMTKVIPADRLRHPLALLRTVTALGRFFRESEAGLVLSWMAKAHLYGGPAARLVRLPAVWFQHAIPGKHWMDRLATWTPSEGVFCCSRAAAEAQQAMVPGRSTRVVYPAVDLKTFDPERVSAAHEVRARLGLPPSRPIVGMAARLQTWKGVHVFVEAAYHIRARCPDAFFIVVGGPHPSEPDYPALLEMKAKKWGVDADFAFVGYQPNVAEWFQAMDVIVHASVSPEPFGMVIIEGMAMGKPVVASCAGGPLEIIRNGEGVLVPPGDAEALADAVVGILSREEEREVMGSAGRERATTFSRERLAAEMARHLVEVGEWT